MRRLEATRVIGICSICEEMIECFQFYYILDDSSLVHDFCYEDLEGMEL